MLQGGGCGEFGGAMPVYASTRQVQGRSAERERDPEFPGPVGWIVKLLLGRPPPAVGTLSTY
jgi:hypothetical protein